MSTLMRFARCMILTVACLVFLGCYNPTAKPERSGGNPVDAGTWPPIAHGGRPIKTSIVHEPAQLRWVCRANLLDDLDLSWLSQLGNDRLGSMCGTGCPCELFECLVLTHKDRSKLIVWPGDLRGEVTIRTREHALEFVRIFSSPETWYKFPAHNLLEIDPGMDDCQESNSQKVSSPERITLCGSLRLPKTSVVERGNAYRILRTALRMHMPAHMQWDVPTTRSEMCLSVTIIEEMVGYDGEYSLRVLWERDLSPDQNFVRLPTDLFLPAK